MKATEFCKFFEFTLHKEHGFDEEDGEYNYIATDDQGTFHPRYAIDVNELTEMFDSMLKDYVDDNLEEDGFEYDDHIGAYYEQALEWARQNEFYKEHAPQMIEVLEALTEGRLEDDTVETIRTEC